MVKLTAKLKQLGRQFLTGLVIGLLGLQLLPTPIAVAAQRDLDPETVESIQEEAEDFADDIGETGIENIKELPESIPETIEEIVGGEEENNQSQQQEESTDKENS